MLIKCKDSSRKRLKHTQFGKLETFRIPAGNSKDSRKLRLFPTDTFVNTRLRNASLELNDHDVMTQNIKVKHKGCAYNTL